MTLASISAGVALAVLGPLPGRADEGRVSYSLPNGLRVRLVRDRKVDEVVVILGSRAAIFEEPAGKPHLAHVAEHLLAHGATPGTAEAEAFTRWFRVNRANGETTIDMMYFDLHVTPEDLPTALRLQAARLSAPTFTRAVLDREVLRALQEAENLERSQEILTSKFAASAFVQAAFFGSNQVPLKQRTKGYSSDDVRGFCVRTFRPERACLVVAGNIEPARVRKEVDAIFGKIVAPADPTPATRPGLKAAHLSATWDLATRHLFLAWPAPPASGPDHPALTLAAALLNENLISDPQIAPLVTFPQAVNEVAGVFYIDVPVKPGTDFEALERKVLDHVVRLSKREGLGDDGVSSRRDALGQMLGEVNLDAMALPPHVSRWLALANLELGALRLVLAWGDLPAYKGRLQAIEGPMLRAVVARYLEPSRATVVRLEPDG